MNRISTIIAALSITNFCITVPPVAQTIVTITLDSTYQTIDGLGSMINNGTGDGNPGQEINDLQVSCYRIFFDAEYNHDLEPRNDNGDPNTLDLSAFVHDRTFLNTAKQAKAAGCEVFLGGVLSPPTWMKDLSEHAYENQQQWACPIYPGNCGGFLRYDMYDEFAEWIEGVITSWRQQAGFDLTAVGMQNEPSFPEPYGSCVYSPSELRDVLKKVGRRLAGKGITTKLLLPEEVIENWGSLRSFVTTVCEDTSAARYMNIIGYHGYASDGVTGNGSIKPAPLLALANLGAKYGKRLWMTETSGYPATVGGGMTVAYGIHCALTYGNNNAWFHYGLNQGQGMVYYAMKNYIRYIRPGAVRVKAVSPDTGAVMASAFKNPRDQTVTIVLVNRKAQAPVTVTGNGLPPVFDVFTTSGTQNCISTGTVSGTAAYPLTLPASSVTTLVGSAAVTVRAPQVAVTHETAAAFYAPEKRVVVDICGRNLRHRRGMLKAHNGVAVTQTGGTVFLLTGEDRPVRWYMF